MRHLLLGLSFFAASVGTASSEVAKVEESLLLEPVGEITFCGEIPVQMSEKMKVDVSNFSFCLRGQSKLGTVFKCAIPIKKTPLWQQIEDAFERGQKHPDGGQIGKMLLPVALCTRIESEMRNE